MSSQIDRSVLFQVGQYSAHSEAFSVRLEQQPASCVLPQIIPVIVEDRGSLRIETLSVYRYYLDFGLLAVKTYCAKDKDCRVRLMSLINQSYYNNYNYSLNRIMQFSADVALSVNTVRLY